MEILACNIQNYCDSRRMKTCFVAQLFFFTTWGGPVRKLFPLCLQVYPVRHTLELGEVYASMPFLVIPPGKRI